jgi:hypothetical protein
MVANAMTTKDWFNYTSDDSNVYAVLLPAWQGKEAKLDFTEWTATNPVMPRGMKMRRALVNHPTDGRSRYLPCGTITADMWANAGEAVLIKERNDVTGTNWVKSGTTAEHTKKTPRDIHAY